MKIRIAGVVVLLMLLAGACRFFPHKNAPMQEMVDYPMLDSVDIFNTTSVDGFTPTPEAVVYARKLYLNAIDLFVNKKNAKESLPIFLKSLRIAPDANTYFKFADALYAAEDYKRADVAYFYAEHYSETMKADAELGQARCAAMQGDSNTAESSLENALEAYPFDVKVISADKAFERLKDSERFKILMAKYGTDDEHRNVALLMLFEKNFAKADLPYGIPPDSVGRHEGKQIDYRYANFIAGMTDGQFSRSVEKDYQYTVALDLSADFKTFIYRTVDFNGDTIYPVHEFLLTIDTSGNTIATQEIACACTPLTIKTAAIDTDGIVEVKEIAQTWKEDPIYKGYAGNEVIKQEVKAVNLYLVTEGGKIVAIKERPVKNGGPAQAESNNQ